MNTKLNKSDYQLMVICYVAVIVFNCVEYYYQGNKLIEYIIDIPVSVITSLTAILLFIYWLIPTILIRQKKYFTFIVLALIILTFLGLVGRVAGLISEGKSFDEYPNWDKLLLQSVFRTANYAGFIFGLILTKKFYEGQTEYIKIEKQQKENELKLLRSQLDPHFLFNNLNTLDALIDSNPTKAKEYINRLSLIYRYLIQTKDSEVMELSEELTLAENYIFLIKTRFGNDYDFAIKKTTSIDDKFIPTGAIQTLLENVVKHNKVSNGKTIKTTIEINENSLAITNEKSKLRSVNPSFGTGLENLKTRYKLLTDKEVLIKNLEDSFLVSIPVINLEA